MHKAYWECLLFELRQTHPGHDLSGVLGQTMLILHDLAASHVSVLAKFKKATAGQVELPALYKELFATD